MSPQGKPKAKHSRASAPKVKTGCLTCKTRHLKCDEEKPICLRCKNDGFQCDGYVQKTAVATVSRRKPKQVYIPTLPQPLDTSIPGSDAERRYFHHFRDATLRDLTSSSHRANFWYDLVLPPAHSNESVRHALVALGAAHWLFVTKPLSPSSVEHNRVENLMLQQYNQAIHHLTTTMSESDSSGLYMTLTCCLIFFCLESIMGRYAESIKHLRAGSRLLTSSSSSPGSSSESSPSGSQNQDAICEIADIFSHLGVDVSLFVNGLVVPDLSSYSRSIGIDETSFLPFNSLADARNHLGIIEVDFRNTLAYHGEDWDTPEIAALFDRIKRWVIRFDTMDVHQPGGLGTYAEQQELIALKLSRRVWLAMIEFENAGPTEQAFSDILEYAEALVSPGASGSHPIFTLQADIVPALVFTCDTTEDSDVQRRAIELLRSMRRREGLWDSQEVAEYLESSLRAREMFPDSWDTSVAGGLAEGARALYGTNSSRMGQNNNIVLMGNQVDRWSGYG